MFASIKGKVLGKSGCKVYIIVKICTDWLLSLTYNLGQNNAPINVMPAGGGLVGWEAGHRVGI